MGSGGFLKLKFRSKFSFFKTSKNKRKLRRHSLLLYELLSGNQVDGSSLAAMEVFFSKSDTEAVAMPGSFGPAQNGKPMHFFVELTPFYLMTLRKVHRKPCRAYIGDQYGCR